MEIIKFDIKKMKPYAKPLLIAIGLSLMTTGAMAQYAGALASVCTIAGFLKQLFGVVAVAAIIILAINSMWGKSELVQQVCTGAIVASVLVIASPTIINKLGFAESCSSI